MLLPDAVPRAYFPRSPKRPSRPSRGFSLRRAALAALEPRQRMLLRLKALIGPAATGKTVFVECLGRLAVGGPMWNHATLTPTLNALRAKGLLTDDLACAPDLLHPLAVEAIGSPEGAAMVEAIRAKLPLDNPQVWDRKLIEDAILRWQRLAVLTNDEDAFQRAASYRHRHGYTSAEPPSIFERHFAAVDVGVEWFASRRPAFQAAILAFKAERWIATGVGAPDYPALMDFCRGDPGLRALHFQRLLNFELLAGRLQPPRRDARGRSRGNSGRPAARLPGLARPAGRRAEDRGPAVRRGAEALSESHAQAQRRSAGFRRPPARGGAARRGRRLAPFRDRGRDRGEGRPPRALRAPRPARTRPQQADGGAHVVADRPGDRSA